MAKEKQEKKKPGIVRQILKWFGLAVLSVLIILGLIFEAPWKVITLLVTILLACTALPKPARKYFWLSAGVVVIALIIWVFLPEDTEGWRPYTFDEELAAIEAKRAIPDSENAAIIYKRLLEDYDPNTMSRDFLVGELERLTHSEPWSSKDYPEIAQWLKNQESTIAKLMDASKIEKYRFPIIADSIALGQHMKILAPMRQWAYLLSRAANNDLGDGRIDQALEKYIAVLQMAKHQCQQPTMIDLLVGMAIEALVTKQFDRFVIVGDATEAHLSVIEKALIDIKHDWSYDLPRILEGEKLLVKNTLCNSAYEINPNGKVRLSRDPWAESRTLWKKQLESGQIQDPQTRKLLESTVYPSYWQKKLIKAKTILGWFFMPSTPQKVAEIIDTKYEEIYAMAEPDFDWEKETEKPPRILRLNYRHLVEHLAGILEPAYYRIHDQYLRLLSVQRASRIIIALRRYKNENGYWPKRLDDIKSLAVAEIFVDPVNDDSFVYKLTEENFTLYSKGKNNIDENGKRDKWDEEKTGADDWLIWPPWTTKAKEENPDA